MDDPDRPVVTLPELMERRRQRHPEATALMVDGERSLTYAGWERRATAVARGLLARGVRPGDRVALLAAASDWLEYAVAYLAAKKVAAATFHLAESMPAAEIDRRLRLCEAVGVVRTSSATLRVDHPGWTAPVPALAHEPGPPVSVRPAPDTLAEIIFTSGTTGTAKAIAVTHEMLTWGLDLDDEVAEIEGGGSAFALYGNPIGSSPGMLVVMTPMVAHPPAVVAVTRQDPDFLAGLIERLGVSAVFVSPWVATELVHARVDERYDLSGVSEFTNASAAFPRPLARRLAQMFPNATMNRAYVSLESVPAFTRATVPAWRDDPGFFDRPEAASVGTARFGAEVAVRDPDGRPLPPGQVGEIWLRTPARQRRYYRSPAANAATYVDGWIRMGDLGHLDEQGRLYVFDRAADAIATRHGLVSSLAIEEVLHEHPAVGHAAAFAATDRATGEQVPAAAVVLTQPASVAQLPELAAQLREFAAARLAAHMVPRTVQILPALPRGTLGKVLKRELRERFGTADRAAHY